VPPLNEKELGMPVAHKVSACNDWCQFVPQMKTNVIHMRTDMLQ